MVPTTREEWREKLLASKRKSVESILEHAPDIKGYSIFAHKTQGGTTFSKDIKDWLGYEKDVTSRWTKIADNSDKLLRQRNCLPPSWSIMYELCDLTEEELVKVARPDLTREELRAALGKQREEVFTVNNYDREYWSVPDDVTQMTESEQRRWRKQVLDGKAPRPEWDGGYTLNSVQQRRLHDREGYRREWSSFAEYYAWYVASERQRMKDSNERFNQKTDDVLSAMNKLGARVVLHEAIEDVVAAQAPDGPQTEEEALALLGLLPGTRPHTIKIVVRWYRQQYHPDKGADPAIAVALNKAVNLLDPLLQLA